LINNWSWHFCLRARIAYTWRQKHTANTNKN